MRNEKEIRLIARRIRLMMGQKVSALYFCHDIEKLVDLILEEGSENE